MTGQAIDYISASKNLPNGYIAILSLVISAKKVSSAQNGHQKFVNALALQEYDSPLDQVVSSTLLGSADFIANIKENFLSAKKPDKELPTLKKLVKKASIMSFQFHA